MVRYTGHLLWEVFEKVIRKAMFWGDNRMRQVESPAEAIKIDTHNHSSNFSISLTSTGKSTLTISQTIS